MSKTLGVQQAAESLDRYFQKLQVKQPSRPLQVRLFSEKQGLDYTYPANSSDQPYHIASIGKVFTATLIQILAERGQLAITDQACSFFAPGELARLFVYRGRDYADQVTIEQLLGHTSGIGDYFEGKTTGGKPFADDVLANPAAHWTPQALVDFTRNHQKAVGASGAVFSYSDTGYILLGIIIERVTGKSFDANLKDEIFQPLGMDDSYLLFYGAPRKASTRPLEKIWFNNVEISGFESLSCDWAGGGIISTTDDLLTFNRALRGGRLIQPAALEHMDNCNHRFRPGIYYGLGMMEIRFKEFFFLLGRLPKVRGHIGILATHMFYDPSRDAHIVMNFGDNQRMVTSFRALIEIENGLQRMG